MSDDNNKPTLGRKPLGLKRTVETGQVQQQFSHGRKNTVVVEVKKKRVFGKPGEAAPAPQPEPVVEAPKPVAPAPVAPKPTAPAPRVSEVEQTLTRKEMQPVVWVSIKVKLKNQFMMF